MPGDAKPFPSGASSNPGGRPKSTPEMIAAREAARATSTEMVNVLIDIARNGVDEKARIMAADKVLDRALGKPTQAIEGTDDGPAIRVNFGPTILIPPESTD